MSNQNRLWAGHEPAVSQTDRQTNSHVPSEIRSRDGERIKTRSILDKQNMCLNKQMQSSVMLESNVRNLAQIEIN